MRIRTWLCTAAFFLAPLIGYTNEVDPVLDIEALPKEMIWTIMDHLNARDASNLMTASRSLYQVARQDSRLGEKRFKRYILQKLKNQFWYINWNRQSSHPRLEERYNEILNEAQTVIDWNLPGLSWNDLYLFLVMLDSSLEKCLTHLKVPTDIQSSGFSRSDILPILKNSAELMTQGIVLSVIGGVAMQTYGIVSILISIPVGVMRGSPSDAVFEVAKGCCFVVGGSIAVATFPILAIPYGIKHGYEWHKDNLTYKTLEYRSMLFEQFKVEIWKNLKERFGDREIPSFLLSSRHYRAN